MAAPQDGLARSARRPYRLLRSRRPEKAGRPAGPPSTIVNLRLPLALLARLDAISIAWSAKLGLRLIVACLPAGH